MKEAISIQYADVLDLHLDPLNPRLGRNVADKGLTQDQVLDHMRDWSLDELAVSFLESGFWPQEALIVVRETMKRKNCLVVVEGNRRLAALRMIQRAANGEEKSSKWKDLLRDVKREHLERLRTVPYILMPSRQAVSAFLGFRHVTGIKEWNPTEKAQFIARLIEGEGLSYEQVRRRIGSKTPTVRHNYISYRLLLQLEGSSEEVDVEKVEGRFSVLYLSLRTRGVQDYLGIDVNASPAEARAPVPKDKLAKLGNYSRWMFGTEKIDPVLSDSRNIDDFGRILESRVAIDYMERTERPSFEVARRMAGVVETEIASHIERAADELEEALKVAHQHKDSPIVQAAVRRLTSHALHLLDMFPAVGQEFAREKP